MAAHARDVNIFIWSSRKWVDHETNDRVMVHGDGTRADGRRFRSGAQIVEILSSRGGRAAGSLTPRRSNRVGRSAANPTIAARIYSGRPANRGGPASSSRSELSPLAISLLVIFLGGKLPKLSFGVANGFVW